MRIYDVLKFMVASFLPYMSSSLKKENKNTVYSVVN